VIDEEDRPQTKFVELVVTVRVTVPENAFCAATVIVEVAGLPAFIVTLVGLAETEKSGDEDWTTTETRVEWESDPFVPVTVTL
jgi:hypothetical protein